MLLASALEERRSVERGKLLTGINTICRAISNTYILDLKDTTSYPHVADVFLSVDIYRGENKEIDLGNNI